jgi:TolA-binding protein
MWDRRRSSETRTSNPTSPTISHAPLNSPPLGPRPHSRSQSYPQNIAALYSSDRYDDNDDLTISQPVSADNSLDEMSFLSSISSLPIPKHDDDSDSDDDVDGVLVYDRSAAPSNASMDSQERVDVLNKTIDELRKKLSDTEKGLNRKVNDLELELEEAQEKLEELKAELIAARKEEKELKSKEVRFSFFTHGRSSLSPWANHHLASISCRNKTKIRFQLSRQRYQNFRRASKTLARHTRASKNNTKNNARNQNDIDLAFAAGMPKSKNTLTLPLYTRLKPTSGTRSSKPSRTGLTSSPQILSWLNRRTVPWMTKRRKTCC